jgi:hypothetical protein
MKEKWGGGEEEYFRKVSPVKGKFWKWKKSGKIRGGKQRQQQNSWQSESKKPRGGY